MATKSFLLQSLHPVYICTRILASRLTQAPHVHTQCAIFLEAALSLEEEERTYKVIPYTDRIMVDKNDNKSIIMVTQLIYLQELIQEYKPSCNLRSSSQLNLMSTSVSTLSYVNRSFCKASAELWNRLPLCQKLSNC